MQETCIYLITFDDGCWLKAELTTVQTDALAEAKATYGDDIASCALVTDATDAAVRKLARIKTSPGYARYCEASDIVQTFRETYEGDPGYWQYRDWMRKYAGRVIGYHGA